MQLGPNQTKFVEDLKTTTFRQCRYHTFVDFNGIFLPTAWRSKAASCCALGRGFFVFGADNFQTIAEKLNTNHEKMMKITQLNDKELKSFAEIGAIIEANPEEFFNGPA